MFFYKSKTIISTLNYIFHVGFFYLIAIGIVLFSACKKDNEDAEGDAIKYANGLCDCFKNYDFNIDADIESQIDQFDTHYQCVQGLFEKYGKYFDEYGNITTKSFEDAFVEELKKCDIR